MPAKTARYVVRSSDVISENKVNVLEEASERVIWYKERYLAEDEIIEHVVENATSTLLWTIHRPLRGWYIRLRAPTFPPSVYISLLPLPKNSPHHTQAALFFSCRTNVPTSPVSPSYPSSSQSPPPPPPLNPSSPSTSTKSSLESDDTLTEPSQSPVSHTYPPSPTPPAILVSPPSPRSVRAKLDSLSPLPAHRLSRPRMQITEFLLAPHVQPAAPEPQQDQGFFSRALRAFRNNTPAPSNSFMICELPPAPPQPPAPPLDGTSGSGPGSRPSAPAARPHRLPPTPLLVFHDTTPVFTLNSTSGIFELNTEEMRKLGVDVGFWIAVALVYGEFLADREGYLAAVAD
ncbi:hypothetical protein DENSPDRAFT_832027 [Dentipellis sp. KUC8613]|nr:hypothetical protein DENSPDRAFT_832027 [Dentipellis sp. KUC8613]